MYRFLSPAPVKLLPVLFGSLFAACGFASPTPLSTEMEQALTAGIHQTPYAALIENTAVEVQPLPDADPSDDYALARWVFTARVLETYRGVAETTLQYSVEMEKGEDPNFGSEPFIILLCRSEGEFYWPGVGFNYPALPAAKALAKATGKNTAVAQAEFAGCTE